VRIARRRLHEEEEKTQSTAHADGDPAG